MRKRLRNHPIPMAIGVGMSALLIGVGVVTSKWSDWQKSGAMTGLDKLEPKSEILPVISLPPEQRVTKLLEIAQNSSLPVVSLTPLQAPDRSRARYLLASDLIERGQGKEALDWLEGLEKEYPVLAAHVMLKRAQAYQSMKDQKKANEAWKQLLEKYPDNPVAAEALFALGQNDAKYWEQAIAKFPNHPRTLEIVQDRLKKAPEQLPLLRILLHNSHDDKVVSQTIDQLTTKFRDQLTAKDWEVIAFNYWEKRLYEKAGLAYASAPPTALNLYRSGRGRQLGGDKSGAISGYQRLINTFPEAKDTGLGLIRLAQMSSKPEDGIFYLDRAIEKFPDHAGQALLEKAKILDELRNTELASQARKEALNKYGNSDAVTEFRWQAAKEIAKQGDYLSAWQWAEPIAKQNPDHELAPEAGFWVGKWAQRLGRSQDAKTAFEFVLSKYPGSFYAWRSATMLGLDVGNFNTVRQKIPQVVRPQERLKLPTGSPALQELHQIGQDKDAWTLWQTEFDNIIKPTVAQQFTDGILLLAVGENRRGINQIESLSWWRDTPEEEAEITAFKQQPIYWHSLYPFPFLEYTETWAQKHQLNPLLVTALMRQESRFESDIRSVAGAVGLMQIMPATGKWVAQQISVKDYNLENPNDNIRLGTWYLDHTHDTYNNNSLLAVASYNAGPGNVSKWINQLGLTDPDEFVEYIPFPETKGYVEHVFENYWNYLRLYNPQIAQMLTQYGHQSFHP
ncbi:transglycosylase SLT domain-containing protein [Phormidium sp. LEGE 05292]|uniref:transglycosylase SLT domain-containing protein n=1 Tax=[Phormidium] sp. LEGE 05292 TaxID=767427 RepID=UPI00187F51A5|nr:transglycosylase SLT domain-containing protein [Phormidium sp. LEGE 05292]MBE9228294.1 transglycosylase SLT domain-containing protein [Phormidium sp. LEGE 05292]